jgi:hypothetical protein
LGGARRRGPANRTLERFADRGIHRRVCPRHEDVAVEPAEPRHALFIQHYRGQHDAARQSVVLRVRLARSEPCHRYGMLLLARRHSPRLPEPVARRMHARHCRRRQRYASARIFYRDVEGSLPVADRALSHFRCAGGRLCAWGRSRRRDPEAALRRAARRRSDLRPDTRHRRQSGWPDSRHLAAQSGPPRKP